MLRTLSIALLANPLKSTTAFATAIPSKGGTRFFASAYSPGAPTFAIVAPGINQFGEDFTAVPLLAVTPVSADTKLFTFATPDPNLPLNLCTCGCMLASGGADADGNPFIRPYTPVSTNALVGKFELMVKVRWGRPSCK